MLWFALSKAVHALLVELLEVKPGENDFAMEWRDSKWARQCSNARFVIDEVLSISSFTRISSRTIRRRSSSFMASSISLEAFLTDFRKLQLRQNVSLARLRLGEKIYSFWMLSPSWIVTDTTASTPDAPSMLALLNPKVPAGTELISQKEHRVLRCLPLPSVSRKPKANAVVHCATRLDSKSQSQAPGQWQSSKTRERKILRNVLKNASKNGYKIFISNHHSFQATWSIEVQLWKYITVQ